MNDVNGIVNAVKAYYTEYGRYPLAPESSRDVTFTDDNASLINILTANPSDPMAMAENARKIVFIEIPKAKEDRGGLLEDGTYVDPWGFPYRIRIDSNYDGQVANPAPEKGEAGPVKTGVIAWSWGKDGKRGESGEHGSRDVVSWR